jgi:hypothetical protein
VTAQDAHVVGVELDREHARLALGRGPRQCSGARAEVDDERPGRRVQGADDLGDDGLIVQEVLAERAAARVSRGPAGHLASSGRSRARTARGGRAGRVVR